MGLLHTFVLLSTIPSLSGQQAGADIDGEASLMRRESLTHVDGKATVAEIKAHEKFIEEKNNAKLDQCEGVENKDWAWSEGKCPGKSWRDQGKLPKCKKYGNTAFICTADAKAASDAKAPAPATTPASTQAGATCTAAQCNACKDCKNYGLDWRNKIIKIKQNKPRKSCAKFLSDSYQNAGRLRRCMDKHPAACLSMLLCNYDELSFCPEFKNSFCQESLARVSLFQSEANVSILTSRHDYVDGVPQPDSDSVAASSIQRRTLSSTKNADDSGIGDSLDSATQGKCSQ